MGEAHKEQEQEEENEREENSKLVKRIYEIIGYEFHDPITLQQAFTHYSYEEGCSSLERLAYIGDATLNLVITQEQYLCYPNLDPGWLTRLRSANVDTEKLARVALKHELHGFLRHNISLLGEQIDEFRDAITDYPLHSSGLIDAPKILADIVESLIGAIFLDCNNLDTTWKVAQKLLEPVINLETLPTHPVTMLMEMCQRIRYNWKTRDTWKENGTFEFVIYDENDNRFIVGRATYIAKRAIAKNRAAHDAYNLIVEKLDAECK